MVGRSIVSSNHWAMKPFMVCRSIMSSNHWAMKPFMVGKSTVSSNHRAMKPFMVGRSIVSSNHWAVKSFMVGRSTVSSNHWAMKSFMVGRSTVSSKHWAMRPFKVGRSIANSNRPVLLMKVWTRVYEINSYMTCGGEWIWEIGRSLQFYSSQLMSAIRDLTKCTMLVQTELRKLILINMKWPIVTELLLPISKVLKDISWYPRPCLKIIICLKHRFS